MKADHSYSERSQFRMTKLRRSYLSAVAFTSSSRSSKIARSSEEQRNVNSDQSLRLVAFLNHFYRTYQEFYPRPIPLDNHKCRSLQ